MNLFHKIRNNVTILVHIVFVIIPGSKDYRYLLRMQTIRIARQLKNKFFAIESIDEQDKLKIKSNIRSTINRFAIWNIKAVNFVYCVFVLAFLLCVLSAIAPPLVIKEFSDSLSNNSAWLYLVSVIVYFMLGVFLFAPPFIVSVFSIKNNRPSLLPFWVLVGWSFFYFLTISLFIVNFAKPSTFPPRIDGLGVISTAFWASAVTINGLIIILGCMFIIVSIIYLVWSITTLLAKDVSMYIVIKLINLIAYIEKYPSGWNDVWSKNQILSDLQVISNIFRHIPRFLNSGDINTRFWVKEIFLQIALTFREYKKWVITPKEDTYQVLTGKFAQALVIIVQGHWDSLEKLPVQNQGAGSKKQMLMNVAKSILSAILPFVILAIYGYFSGSVPDTVVVVALFWVIISIVPLLDPMFFRKATIFSEYMSIFPFSSDNILKTRSNRDR